MTNPLNALFWKIRARYPNDQDLELLQMLAAIGPKDDLELFLKANPDINRHINQVLTTPDQKMAGV